MEAGHPVVAAPQHLRVGAELHGPAAGAAHPHSPHVNQLGTHGTAHGVCMCVYVRACVKTDEETDFYWCKQLVTPDRCHY